ncbi:NADPH oxidase [Fusarium oxysporum NRRL 32931]|uniref:NADPH oxidase n=1 Tax=Fusarium oxysporum NRRL 32931 TaxID=660029 RepID=W9HBJ7_FUSOX|nr:NADPH oxidase [Fusarium oxysporum NRRL 32931]
MLLCMLLMYTTVHVRIRRQSFEIFWYAHHLFIPFFLGLYTHTVVVLCAIHLKHFLLLLVKVTTWDTPDSDGNWSLAAFTSLRGYIENSSMRDKHHEGGQISKWQVTSMLAGRFCLTLYITDVVELQFSKPSFKYRPGQWLFLEMPSISRYQWHPFTITSCSFDPYVSVHIRLVGDLTRALGNAVDADPAQAKFYEETSSDPVSIYEVAIIE